MNGIIGLQAIHDRILKARIALALRQPYLASGLMRLPIRSVQSSYCPTFATDGFVIYYNPTYVQSLTDEEVRGVMAHELMHVILKSLERQGQRNSTLWNLASDYVINLILNECGFILPKGSLWNPQYRSMTAEDVYDSLLSKSNTDDLNFSLTAVTDHTKVDVLGDDRSGCIPNIGPDLIRESLIPSISQTIKEDAEERRQIVESIRAELTRTFVGQKSHSLRQELSISSEKGINWTALLQVWLTDRLKVDWSLYPPNKRHIWQGLMMPSVGVPQPCHLVFLIDTSASMRDEELSRILAEVSTFRESFPTSFTVIQADIDVQSVRQYEAFEEIEISDLKKIKGRGGTDFRPAFSWIDENFPSQAVAIIHATDGMGQFPASIDHPIVWLIPKEIKSLPKLPNWGDILRV